MLNSGSFWDLPACSKLETLEEHKHFDKLLCALNDPDTQIDKNSGPQLIIYGPEQALLVNLHSFPMKLIMSIYSLITS